METIAERVAKGAALLDQVEEHPNWFSEINLNTLNITNVHDCVLGQLYGNYYDGKEALFGKANRWDHLGSVRGREYGFNLTPFEWDTYNDAADEGGYSGIPDEFWESWRAEINKRVTAAKETQH